MEAILSDYGEVFFFFYVSILTLLIQYNFQTLGFLAPALEHHIKNEFSYSLSQYYISISDPLEFCYFFENTQVLKHEF